MVLGDTELIKWSTFFADLDPAIGPLGNGNGVTHVFANLGLAKRLLSMVPVPGLAGVLCRQPDEQELLLEEEIQAKRLMDGASASDAEEEGDPDETEVVEEEDED